ncbi:hypothetical protein [Burkholderia sp. IMCC1007]|uniref:hypothetical protein n=1 Tax=Burkholderia sp. IMCC1007 TaxID=3004104 RepID=UPI0022B4F13A|nr:hypothetical protein [Burkholderia sp. IMCC1007]
MRSRADTVAGPTLWMSAGEQRSPPLVAINSNGKIPTAGSPTSTPGRPCNGA